ncbi:hypothetical protein tb265_49640 [Gemmatimonadetes bacterium T265]|nr:hypothetical protein tb265_49640 [Gemmatimonadetes bacterium T265]
MADASQLGATLGKVLMPTAAIGVALGVARRRGMSVRDDVGVRPPPLGSAALWVAAYVVWMLGTDRVLHWRGPWDFSQWARTPLPVAVLRVLAVGVLGPVAEELIFRGVAYDRLLRAGVPVAAAVVLLAAVWSLLHVGFSAAVVGVVFVAGVLLGAARRQTGSVLVPIAMHVVWNCYAVW